MSGKRYGSVLEMVRDTASPEFAITFERLLRERDIIDRLMSLRCLAGATTEQLASKMRVKEKTVSRFEAMPDARLRLGDVFAYAAALGYRVNVTFTKE